MKQNDFDNSEIIIISGKYFVLRKQVKDKELSDSQIGWFSLPIKLEAISFMLE